MKKNDRLWIIPFIKQAITLSVDSFGLAFMIVVPKNQEWSHWYKSSLAAKFRLGVWIPNPNPNPSIQVIWVPSNAWLTTFP